MPTARVHIIPPSELLHQQEVRRSKLSAFLRREEPAWKTKDHPELKRGAATWVSKMRRSEQKLRDSSITHKTAKR